MSIYTNDLSKLAVYNLRFKVYLTGDPNNILEKNFKIDVKFPCLNANIIKLDPANVLKGASPVLDYKVSQPAV